MRIGDLSQRTGVPARMLRYYEQQGLLRPERTPNGYRSYAEADVARAQRVRSLISSGMPTRLIAIVLDMDREQWSPSCSAQFARQLEAELASIEDKISCLTLSRDTIRDYLDRSVVAAAS
jgi:DNA-binding transcriptional MerR regulator